MPSDMNLILDDDLAEIFARVRQGVIFTLLAGNFQLLFINVYK